MHLDGVLSILQPECPQNFNVSNADRTKVTFYLPSVAFFQGFFNIAKKWRSSIGTCRKSGYFPQKNAAKSGYQTQILNHTSIFLASY
jgi:hypothetical protein